MIDVAEVLARIDAWYAAHVPAVHAQLRPGAAESALDALESTVGAELPSAFRTLYRWHDGEDWQVGGMFDLEFMPLSTVGERWRGWQEIGLAAPFLNEESPSRSHPAGAIRDAYTCPGWIGFLVVNGQGHVGLDLDPGPTGRRGQVITFGRDEAHKYVLAASLEAFLREYLDRLESGRVSVRNRASTDPGAVPFWAVELHDARGSHQDGFFFVADRFPGFGAAPAAFLPSAER